MAILRKKHDRNFTTISNEALKDKNLSFKAKGLLTYMWSLPDDWEFYETEIVNHSTDGISSVRSGLQELVDNGYLVKQRKRDDNGRLTGNDWLISDVPTFEPDLDFQNLGKPNLDKPNLDIQTLLNTNTTKNLSSLKTDNTKAANAAEKVPYKEIVGYLNKKTGKKISHKTEGNRKLIRARWNEGYDLTDFKKVIDNKCTEWLGQGIIFTNGKPAENYLHPSTLFRASHFDKYLNQSQKQQGGGGSYGNLEY